MRTISDMSNTGVNLRERAVVTNQAERPDPRHGLRPAFSGYATEAKSATAVQRLNQLPEYRVKYEFGKAAVAFIELQNFVTGGVTDQHQNALISARTGAAISFDVVKRVPPTVLLNSGTDGGDPVYRGRVGRYVGVSNANTGDDQGRVRAHREPADWSSIRA